MKHNDVIMYLTNQIIIDLFPFQLWQDKHGGSGFSGSGEARTNLGAFAGDKVKRKTKSVYNLNDCNV